MLNMALEFSAQAAAVPNPREIARAVELTGVTKSFAGKTVLQHTDLIVPRGTFLTLLGPSGCGKTTMLNLMSGFLTPDRGDIVLEGRRVTDVPPYDRDIGIVFQNYALFPHMNVGQNVGYGLRMRGIGRRAAAERVAAMLDLVKLNGFADRRPAQLSGGQQQRVALARALVIEPKVLLLDEPFSALDVKLRAAMQLELKAIQRKVGITTIFVTHDQGEALSLSDQIAVMSEGRIHQLGTPDEIYRHPKDPFVAAFVGDVSILRAKLERRIGDRAVASVGSARIDVSALTLGDCRAEDPIDLYLRPEDLDLSDTHVAGSLAGQVVAAVYQGSHMNVVVGLAEAREGTLTVRCPGSLPPGHYRPGMPVYVGLPSRGVSAFPAADVI
jgi:spermidine/putrescine ABC transporter ATP-binding subunit